MPKPVFIPKKPVKKAGRPTLLNPTRQAALLEAIEQGMPLKQAAAVAGMSYDTLNHWQKRGENESAPPEYCQFYQQLRRSQAIAMQVHVSSICDAAKRDWRAAAWMLERRFPEDFARTQQLEHSGPGGKPQTPYADEEYEVLRRMKKQQGIKELMMKLGSIIMEKKRQQDEAAKVDVEALRLQTPLHSTAKMKPQRAPLRE
ncbi:MAG: hypothetical protein JNM65_16755 [Verrucomicrobiaceae bacterium]|nr:hypothetical protein [Verrucomicrobiaceae bacterium]